VNAGVVLAAGVLGALSWGSRHVSGGRPSVASGAAARWWHRFRGVGAAQDDEPAHFARGVELGPLVVPSAGRGRLVLGTCGRRLVAAESGHSVLVVGPTQSYKTSGFAVPAILEWEGPVLAASVKSDLARHTLSWRRRQGTVWLYDPARSTGLARAPWSPLSSCRDWSAARRIAHALTESARPAAGSLTDGDFWYATATKLLGPLLLAAATSNRSMVDVVRWIDEQEEDEVAVALTDAGAWSALQAARATWARDDRQRSAVYTTAETVVEAFAEDGIEGGAGSPIDPAGLLDGHHTLYLCAPGHDQRRLRALFTALAGEVLQAAFRRSTAEGAPLDPPLLVVLDEAANVAPLAELDTLAATAAGHGVQLVTVWQDLAQIGARYGARAGTVMNNHRVKVFLSGIADLATLEQASALVGDTARSVRSSTVDARGGRTTAEATERTRLLPPDALRRLRPGNAVAVSGHRSPVRLRLRPWWRDAELRTRAELQPPAVFDSAPASAS